MDEQHGPAGDDADELLRRALIDPEASVAVALRVGGLALADALTVVFHGRARPRDDPDLRRPRRPRGAGSAIGADELLRVPCDLDLGDAGTRDEAEEAYAEQARALRDALLAADTVLAIWREPLRGPRRGARSASTARSTSQRPPARPPPHAGRARRARAPHHRRAGVRRAHAGRGPPADGHRLRPAGRRARLSAARRPRALPRGLRRSAPPSTRAAWPSASSTRRPRCGASWSSTATTSPRPAERARTCAAAASLPAPVSRRAKLAHRRRRRRLPRRLASSLARYLSTENRERDADLRAAARPGARRRAAACSRRLDGCDARCRADRRGQRAPAARARAT